MPRSILSTLLLTFVIWTTSCSDNNQTSKPSVPDLPTKTNEKISPLIGSWEMQEIHWKTPDTTYSIQEAHPGIFMIDANRYAIIWTPTRDARTPFEVLSKPTDEEIKAGFQSIVFNSGTHEFTDSTLTTTAIVAKVPGFEGGKQYYRYSIDGKTMKLTMFDETYPNGDKPEWFGKYVTEFVMQKVE